jgi:uncharacterized membrane protein
MMEPAMRKMIVTALATALLAATAAQPAFAAKHSRTAPKQQPTHVSQPVRNSMASTAPMRDVSRYQNGAMSAPAGR